MNRRDLLKFFGAGAVIAPVATAAPLVTIIEPPKVELYRSVPSLIDLTAVKAVGITLTMQDGSAHAFSVKPKWRRGVISPGDSLELHITAGLDYGSPPLNSGQITARGWR